MFDGRWSIWLGICNECIYLFAILFICEWYLPKMEVLFANYTLFTTSCGSMISKYDRIHIWWIYDIK